MKGPQDTKIFGFLIGLTATFTILFGFKVYHFDHMSFWIFLKTGFVTGTLSPWLKLATLFNLAPFFYFININRMKTAQGVVFATIFSGLFIIYFTLM